MILLLNILIIVAAVAPSYSVTREEKNESVQVLSKLGSRGNEVRQVQTKLKSLGYYTGKVDGIYGTGTQSAVKKFQKIAASQLMALPGRKLCYISALPIAGGSSGSTGKYSQSDINLLARMISAEARGESYTGQVAVGAVILNRVQHASFPDTIAGVIYQPGAFTALNDSNWSKPIADSARKAAQDCINGWDPSGGAIYYYNPKKTTNKWMLSRPVVKTIGNHKFCK